MGAHITHYLSVRLHTPTVARSLTHHNFTSAGGVPILLESRPGVQRVMSMRGSVALHGLIRRVRFAHRCHSARSLYYIYVGTGRVRCSVQVRAHVYTACFGIHARVFTNPVASGAVLSVAGVLMRMLYGGVRM